MKRNGTEMWLAMGWTLAAIVALIVSPAGARASSVAVANHSFEDHNVADNGADVGPGIDPSGAWTLATGYSYIVDPVSSTYAGTDGDNVQGVLPDGGQYATISTYFGGVLGGGLSQSVGTVAADTTYTLTVAVGTRLDYPSGDWEIQLLAGPTLGSATLLASTPAQIGPATAGTFQDYSLIAGPLSVGNPSIGQNLIINLIGFNPSGNTLNELVSFDNVRLDAMVPEPASLGLLAAGAGAMLLRRRR